MLNKIRELLSHGESVNEIADVFDVDVELVLTVYAMQDVLR